MLIRNFVFCVVLIGFSFWIIRFFICVGFMSWECEGNCVGIERSLNDAGLVLFLDMMINNESNINKKGNE